MNDNAKEQVRPTSPLDRLVRRHTPGPWFVHQTQGYAVATIGRDTRIAADLAAARDTGPDAALIAAAPDMLEALDNLVSACELPGDHCEVEQALPAAIAALAKALGVTPNT